MVEFLVGVALALLGIGLGEVRARTSKRQLAELPSETAKSVARVLGGLPAMVASSNHGRHVPGAYAGYADIDNDGEPELIVQHPAGVHGMKLTFYDWGRGGFNVVGETGSGTPTSARIGDVDGDGRVEIATLQTDWDAGRPYVEAPSQEWFFRWDGEEFVEVGRGERWDPLQGDPSANIRKYFEPPSWAF